jgi:PAS domain S-box-containing protein
MVGFSVEDEVSCIEKAGTIILQFSAQGKILMVNETACRSLGYTRDELIALGDADIAPAITDEKRLEYLRNLDACGSMTVETVFLRKDGSTFPIEFTVIKLDSNGKSYLVGFGRDVSERRKAEEQIRGALAEKTVLLKEVHHRVKNNLQIICALLDLQSESIPDEQSRICFQYSRDRVRSMALVHEQLNRSRNFASIDFADYVESLAACLFDSYVVDPGRITLRVEAESVLLGIDVSIPCGLIISELVSNSLKHAFADGREGEVVIGLNSGTDGWISISVADTGVGFPPGTDVMNAPTLGLQIVSMLVKQVRGQIELRNDNGAYCMVRFRGRLMDKPCGTAG